MAPAVRNIKLHPLSNLPAKSEVNRWRREGEGGKGLSKAGNSDTIPRSWQVEVEKIESLRLPLAI